MTFISGTVFDLRDNAPISGVTFILTANSIEGDFYAEVTTDAAGHYRIDPAEPAPDYSIEAVGKGYSRRMLAEIPVTPSGSHQDIGLVKHGMLSGTVLSAPPSLLPVSGAAVYLWQLDDPNFGVQFTSADSSGNYLISAVDVFSSDNPFGSNYSILIESDTYSHVIDTAFIPACYEQGDGVTANFVVNPRGSVRGTLYSAGLPLTGASVYAYENLSGALMTGDIAVTDGLGNFELFLDAPGDYRIAMQAEGTSAVSALVTIRPGQINQLSPITIAAPGTLQGVVRDLDANAVPGAAVQLFVPDGFSDALLSTSTNSVGFYRFDKVAAFANYTLSVTLPRAELVTGFVSERGINIASGVTTMKDFWGDTVPPTCQIISPTSREEVSGNMIVTVNVADNQAVYSLYLLVDGEEVAHRRLSDPADPATWIQQDEISLLCDISGWDSGTHTLKALIYDLAGNEAEEELPFNVDSTTV